MDKVAAEKRRSDRLWLTIPVRVRCVDSDGEAVELAGRAVSINRYGGRTIVPRELDWSRPIRLRRPIGNFEVEFRVVEPVNIQGHRWWEYGVECLDEKFNFWDIEFPPLGQNPGDEKALLDCGTCHTIALMSLAMVEYECLKTEGRTAKYCARCSSITQWWYAEKTMSNYKEPQYFRPWVESEAT